MEQETVAKKSRAGRVLLQVPLSPAERRSLKHRAIEEGTTLGEIVRIALGFPPLVKPTEQERAV